MVMVNKLLTNSIRVNVPFSDLSRRMTTGDDHEVQEGSPDPWSLVVAVRFRLGFCRRKRINKNRPFWLVFCQFPRRSATRRRSSFGVSERGCCCSWGAVAMAPRPVSAGLRPPYSWSLLARCQTLVDYPAAAGQTDRGNNLVILRKDRPSLLLVPEGSEEVREVARE